MAGNLLLALDGHHGPARVVFPMDKGQDPLWRVSKAVCTLQEGTMDAHLIFLPVSHKMEGELGLREGKRPARTTQLGKGGGARRRTQVGVNELQ